jgi:hypothetical protein
MIFRAKFSSFAAFILLYTLASNALAVVIVGTYLAPWRSRALLFLPRYMLAHLAAAAAANFTVFFLIVALQAILFAVLSPGLFRRLSLLVRFGALAAIFYVLTLFVLRVGSWSRLVSEMDLLRAQSSDSLLAYPPMWFIGLYEVLLGSGIPMDRALAGLAVLIPITLAGLYFLTMGLSFKKHLRRPPAESSRPGPSARLATLGSGWVDRLLLRNPVERAVFHFFGRTLRRSTLHKMRLAAFLAAASGLVLVLMSARGSGPADLSPSNRNLLAAPLVLTFFLLVGLRSLVAVPFAPEANWIFALTEQFPRRPYYSGLKKAVVLLTLLPLMTALLPVYALLWGFATALIHLAFGLVCSLVLLELLFLRFSKIPFACLPAPKKAKPYSVWIGWFVGFLVYVVLLGGLEQRLLAAPSAFPVFFAVGGAVLLGLVFYQELFTYPRLPLVYEEEPEPVLVTLE